MTIHVEIDPAVFNPVYIPYLNNNSRIQILFGGASSGKSHFLAQRAVIDVMRGGRNYLVVRQVGRTLRGSVIQEITRVIREWNLSGLFEINKTDHTATCSNGFQVVFAGLDDVEKLKSIVPAKGAFSDIWIEEATETSKSSIKELYRRQRGGSEDVPKRLTMSFNPILQSHWIFGEYFSHLGWNETQTEYKDDSLSILKTTYLDNRFITHDDRKDLENEQDEYDRSVYVLGNWGILGHVIFTNWKVQDLSTMRNQFTNRRNGLDFGFSLDPAAASRTHYDRAHKRIYIFGELYEIGLTNDLLAKEVIDLVGSDPIVCDSAEPKSIAELRKYGVNALSAKKGMDSVNFGIQWLQQQEIIVDSSCINTQNEMRQYHWKTDKNGNAIKVPSDKNNHIIDELRYAYEDDMDGGGWAIGAGG